MFAVAVGGIVNGFIDISIFYVIVPDALARQSLPCHLDEWFLNGIVVNWFIFLINSLIALTVNTYQFRLTEYDTLSEATEKLWYSSLVIGCLNSTVMFSFGCYVAKYTNSQCWAATVLPIWAGFVGGLYYFYFLLDRQTRRRMFCCLAKKQWPITASGWEVRNSKRYPGRNYYFNPETGVKLWSIPKEHTIENPLNGEEQLPEGWHRKESKKHPGHVFYFNPETGEKSWDRPVEALEAGALEAVDEKLEEEE